MGDDIDETVAEMDRARVPEPSGVESVPPTLVKRIDHLPGELTIVADILIDDDRQHTPAMRELWEKFALMMKARADELEAEAKSDRAYREYAAAQDSRNKVKLAHEKRRESFASAANLGDKATVLAAPQAPARRKP